MKMTDSENAIIHWVDRNEAAQRQHEEHLCSPRNDPTANAAIGNIMREERKKKRREKNKYNTQVWRAEDKKT